MATSLLLCRRVISAANTYNNGVRIVTLQPLGLGRDQYLCTTRFLRTSGVGNEGPYDTAHVRKNSASASASLTMPPLPGTISDKHRESEQQILAAEKDASASRDVMKEKFILQALTYMTKTFDFLTLPVYAALNQPWKKLALHKATKAIAVQESPHEWTGVLEKSKIHMELDEHNIDTLDKLFTRAAQKHSTRKCLGTREVLGVVEEEDQLGKLVKKYDLGEYDWITYNEMQERAATLSRGMRALGLKPKQRIAIFAETRAEWLLTAVAAFKMNLPIVTVFATLGDEGVIHALSETEVSCLFTSEELLGRCSTILKNVPLVKNVVCINGQATVGDGEPLPTNVSLNSLSSLNELGESQPVSVDVEASSNPQRDDTAIIMYTSGSTGVPKGVMLSHGNLVASLKALTDSFASFGDPTEDDCYIAYLPLAHALELMSEAMCLLQGIQIGYSSPLTLTDKSVAVKAGCKGDASLLKPTLLGSVPLVLERILKAIQGKISERGKEASLVFDFFTQYKCNWTRLGYNTPLVDRIFFAPIRDLVGGKVRLVTCGGAPLATQTHEIMRAVLGCPVLQGYGLTETTGSGSMSIGEDLTVGRIGGPISCTTFRLINWETGGYRVTDKPYPRGELYIGGENVAMGYFNKPDCTDFFIEDGKRWMRTGDIVEVHPDGAFRIIDRKKDLVKLSSGEFISLGKVEAVLKTIPIVENICLYADPTFSYPVAVVVPSQVQVEKLAAQLGRGDQKYLHLTTDPVIVDAVLKEIENQAYVLKLDRYEIPRKIYISPEIWTPQSGLVTAAFKIKRNNVYKHFYTEIQKMLRG